MPAVCTRRALIAWFCAQGSHWPGDPQRMIGVTRPGRAGSVEAPDELLDLFFLRVSLPAQDSGGLDSSLRGDVREDGAG